MRELSTATDQVSVGARFGSSGNPGCPARLLSERCAIYLQPHHILLGYVCDRFARCGSACRNPIILFLPKHQAALDRMVHRLPKICSRTEHCSSSRTTTLPPALKIIEYRR